MSDSTDPAPLVRDYYLLIPHPTRPQVLMQAGAAGWSLPHFQSADPDLFAGGLIRQEMHAQLGIDVTLLRTALADIDPALQRWRWAVIAVENHSPAWAPPPGNHWVDRAMVRDLPLAQPEQQETIAAYLAEQESGNLPGQRTPWARPGWLARATAWMAAELGRRDLGLLGPVEQLKSWSISCLLRGSTPAGTVYFKATPDLPLFAHEPAVTATLAAEFPGHIPMPLAVQPAERWMLLADFGGTLLAATPDPARETALCVLAAIQQAAVTRVDRLLAAGCLDRRLPALVAAIDPLIRDTETFGILEPAQLARLQAAAPRLAALAEALAEYRVPQTLIHGDLHDHNIAMRAGVPLFFDWSDSAIAHPFFDLATLLDTRHLEAHPAEHTRLRDRYLEYWTRYEPMNRLIAAAALATPLGLLHQCISYQHIVTSAEPTAQWECADGWRYFMQKLIDQHLP